MAEPLSPLAPGDGEPGARLGPRLLVALHGVLRSLRLYDSSNQTLREQIQGLLSVILAAMEDEVELLGMGDYFYLNGARLKPGDTQVHLYRSLMSEFEIRALSGLRFTSGLATAELETFLKLFLAARDGARGERLPEEARALGILHIVPVLARDLGARARCAVADEPGSDGERQRARRTYWRAVKGTQHLVASAAQTGRPALHLARRLVQPVVDSVLKDEYSILGLTALKDHDEYTYAHCVNVSVLSIGIGQILGFPRQALATLGVAALLHDLGKLAVPSAVLQKPGVLGPEEWVLIHRHPLEGAKMIARLPALSTLSLDSMRVALEHHVHVDRSGYPKSSGRGAPSTLARIVAVADFFDAVTSHRAYRKRPLTTYEGLRLLTGPERHRFDAAAVWGLVRTVGAYPAGTVMLTGSGHVVLSLSPNPRDPGRPHCRVLRRPDGSSPLPDSPEIWDPMPEQERVLRVLGPDELGVDVGALLAA